METNRHVNIVPDMVTITVAEDGIKKRWFNKRYPLSTGINPFIFIHDK